MTPDAVARWERERSRGRSHFIWRRGVAGWGVPAAMLTIAYRAWQLHTLGAAWTMTPDLREGIFVAAIVFPFCGYAFGAWLWGREEEEYSRHRRGET